MVTPLSTVYIPRNAIIQHFLWTKLNVQLINREKHTSYSFDHASLSFGTNGFVCINGMVVLINAMSVIVVGSDGRKDKKKDESLHFSLKCFTQLHTCSPLYTCCRTRIFSSEDVCQMNSLCYCMTFS